jgi:hypothetical protein
MMLGVLFQGPGYTSMYGKCGYAKMKNGDKIGGKSGKNRGVCCLRVQGAFPNMESMGMPKMKIMSPYEFMSKTHSLSTEDLGKIFIH